MAARHHAQRENGFALPPLTHAILLAQHANTAPGRSELPPKFCNTACYHCAVRAALPAQRVTSFAAARNSIVLSGINYATPSMNSKGCESLALLVLYGTVAA